MHYYILTEWLSVGSPTAESRVIKAYPSIIGKRLERFEKGKGRPLSLELRVVFVVPGLGSSMDGKKILAEYKLL